MGRLKPAPTGYETGSTERFWVAATFVLALALVAALGRGSNQFSVAGNEEASKRLSIVPTGGATLDQSPLPVISPDGQYLAVTVTTADGTGLLWIHSLHGLTSRALPGTEGASLPFWSPDSQSLGFFADGKLKTTSLAGDVPRALGEAPHARGGTWNGKEIIVFAPDSSGALYQVPARGGHMTRLTELDRSRGEVSHRWPYFLPDDRHFLYLAASESVGMTGIYLGSVESAEKQEIVRANSSASYATSGYLLLSPSSTLMAQRFDIKRFQSQGKPFPLAKGVGREPSGLPAFSVSQTGVLTFWENGNTRELRWVDRSGHERGSVGPRSEYGGVTLMADEKRAAVWVKDLDAGRMDLSRIDLASGHVGRLSDEDPEYAALKPLSLSPNGRWVAYISREAGQPEVFVKLFGRVMPYWKVSTDGGTQPLWRKDGKELFYVARDQKLMAVPVKSEATFEAGVPTPLFQTSVPDLFDDRHGYGYAVTADGQRFLVNSPVQDTSPAITLVSNWTAVLPKR